MKMTTKETVLLAVFAVTITIVFRPIFPDNLEYILACFVSGVTYGAVSALVKS